MSNSTELAALIESSPEFSWLESAACGDLGLDQLDLFFVEAGRTLSREAAAICGTCPVRAECLEHATARDIAGGYFGGVSPSKRRRMATTGDQPLTD
jgi:WhiB family redox-sensing transcriptional regulator